jgi:hypothetical protein
MTWIGNRLFFWRQTIRVPVTITISDALHKKKQKVYYEVDKYRHRKH